MNLSDEIANLILEALSNSEGIADIQRNELATRIGCVPSAINYVITSRFTPQQGYLVESRRGGGGYIRITRISSERQNVIMHVVNSIGATLDEHSCRIILRDLLYRKLLSEEAAKIIATSTMDRTLCDVPSLLRERVRATVFKSMIMSTM